MTQSYTEHILEEFIDKVLSRIGGGSCEVYLWDKPRRSLVLRAGRGPLEVLIGKAKYEMGEGLTGRVAMSQEPVFIRSSSAHPAWRGKYDSLMWSAADESGVQSAFLGIPIRCESQILGVVKITGSVGQFEDIDVGAARALAQELAEKLVAGEGEDVSEEIYTAEFVRIELLTKVNTRVLEYLSRHPEAMHKLDPVRFEELVARLLEEDGWSVDLTLPTRDGGFDILAVRNVDGIAVQLLAQAKKHRPDRAVGVSAIRELYAVKLRHHASKAILATTSYVSPPAKKEFGDVIPWELEFKEYNDLTAWLSRHKPKGL